MQEEVEAGEEARPPVAAPDSGYTDRGAVPHVAVERRHVLARGVRRLQRGQPGAAEARSWEPAPGVVYAWERATV